MKRSGSCGIVVKYWSALRIDELRFMMVLRVEIKQSTDANSVSHGALDGITVSGKGMDTW